MPRRRSQHKSRGRARSRHALEDLLPDYLRPGSEAWEHFQAAKREFLKGVRAVLDQLLAAQVRRARRRSGLKKIAVE